MVISEMADSAIIKSFARDVERFPSWAPPNMRSALRPQADIGSLSATSEKCKNRNGGAPFGYRIDRHG